MVKLKQGIKVSGKFTFRGLITLMLILFLAFILFRVSRFLYAGVFGNEVIRYQANLASSDQVLKNNYLDFNIGMTPIPQLGKTVVIDIKKQELHLFKKGELENTFALLAVPEYGSAWESSGGGFSVIRKEEKHLSPIAGLTFPYTVQFFGNSLIHGEPTNSEGRIAKTLTGGFRLKNDDALKVFNWIDLDSRVLVYGARWTLSGNNHFSYIIKKSQPAPLTANSYLVSDLKTKEVILSKNKDKKVPIASVSKLMTALVALERLGLDTKITVSRQAYETYGDSGRFQVGDELSLEIMLYPLLLESSNDAAEAIAERVGREKFISEMNKKAKELGMEETFFEDPSGLSPNNVSSAGDLVKLADYICQNKNSLFDITKLKEYKYNRFVWTNRNNLIEMNYYIGGKNGYTDEANRTLLALYELPLSEFEVRKIVLVLLGSDDRKSDARNIINYVTGNVAYNGPSVFKMLGGFEWDDL